MKNQLRVQLFSRSTDFPQKTANERVNRNVKCKNDLRERLRSAQESVSDLHPFKRSGLRYAHVTNSQCILHADTPFRPRPRRRKRSAKKSGSLQKPPLHDRDARAREREKSTERSPQKWQVSRVPGFLIAPRRGTLLCSPPRHSSRLVKSIYAKALLSLSLFLSPSPVLHSQCRNPICSLPQVRNSSTSPRREIRRNP